MVVAAVVQAQPTCSELVALAAAAAVAQPEVLALLVPLTLVVVVAAAAVMRQPQVLVVRAEKE